MADDSSLTRLQLPNLLNKIKDDARKLAITTGDEQILYVRPADWDLACDCLVQIGMYSHARSLKKRTLSLQNQMLNRAFAGAVADGADPNEFKKFRPFPLPAENEADEKEIDSDRLMAIQGTASLLSEFVDDLLEALDVDLEKLTGKKPPRGRGRPKADNKTCQQEAKLFADWERARENKVSKANFAKDKRMGLDKLERLLWRVSKRNSRSTK